MNAVPQPVTLLPDRVLDQLANVADHAADDLVGKIAQDVVQSSADKLETRRDDFPALMGVLADEKGPAAPFLAEGEELNDYIQPDLVHHAQAFFEEFGVEIITALFDAALPEAYLGRRGVQVLDMTGELVSNWTRRIQETGQFLVNVLSPDPEFEGSDTTLTSGHPAARAVRRVRLRHAAVRWLLQAPYDPSYPTIGIEGQTVWAARMCYVKEDRIPTKPLNQEDLLATLGTFTSVTFDALEKMGVPFDDADRNAFYHLWNVVGWHLGIGAVESLGDINTGAGAGRWPDNALFPLSPKQIDKLFGRLRHRLQGPTDAGVRLAKTLVQEMSYPLPRPVQGAPEFFIRYLIGDEHADMLEIGAGGYFPLLVQRTGALEHIAKRVRLNALTEPVLAALSHTVTRYALRAFVAESRGINQGFSIDPRIANQWGVQTGPEVRPPAKV